MWERTLVIIKPDAVMKRVEKQIKDRYIAAGLQLSRELAVRLDARRAKELYSAHEGRFYFEGLVLAMASGPCTVLIVEGDDAVRKVRDMNGATDPKEAEPGTIRRDFRSAGGPFNTVHSSDSSEAAEREIRVFGF